MYVLNTCHSLVAWQPPRVLGSAVIRTGEHLKQPCGLQLECSWSTGPQAHRDPSSSPASTGAAW